LRAKELFWCLTCRKYELGRVVERGEERFRVANLKIGLWGSSECLQGDRREWDSSKEQIGE
jgi:hypothetical protein